MIATRQNQLAHFPMVKNNPVKTLRAKLKAHHHPIKLMGCGFVLTAVDRDPQRAWDALRAGVAEIQRIENLISSWKKDSETTAINNQAGIKAVSVSPELWALIDRSLRVSQLTCGAFDISGNLSRHYWNFNGKENDVLSEEKIQELRGLINYRLIELNAKEQSVFLRKRGMKIGFGGIGKGYAAYRAYQVMQGMGIASGLINASGDLMCWGKPPQSDHWTIQLPDPDRPRQEQRSLFELSIPNGAVVTSGNYENYTLIDGKPYSHIIDPRTGWPVRDTKNVSVVCPNPELADALATALSVLGATEGIPLINQLKGVECVITEADGSVHYSKHLKSFGIC